MRYVIQGLLLVCVSENWNCLTTFTKSVPCQILECDHVLTGMPPHRFFWRGTQLSSIQSKRVKSEEKGAV
jgi:hypothetical protein